MEDKMREEDKDIAQDKELEGEALEHKEIEAQQRIVLEMRIAEQEKMLEDLSLMVTKHWQIISQLQAKITRLQYQYSRLEEHMDLPEANKPPPHW